MKLLQSNSLYVLGVNFNLEYHIKAHKIIPMLLREKISP